MYKQAELIEYRKVLFGCIVEAPEGFSPGQMINKQESLTDLESTVP